MNSFALYRLPHQSVCTLVEQTEGLPLEWHSCEELTGHTGFVVAPFADSPWYPGLLIRADLVSVNSIVTNCFQCRNKLFPVRKQMLKSVMIRRKGPTTLRISAFFMIGWRLVTSESWS